MVVEQFLLIVFASTRATSHLLGFGFLQHNSIVHLVNVKFSLHIDNGYDFGLRTVEYGCGYDFDATLTVPLAVVLCPLQFVYKNKLFSAVFELCCLPAFLVPSLLFSIFYCPFCCAFHWNKINIGSQFSPRRVGIWYRVHS